MSHLTIALDRLSEGPSREIQNQLIVLLQNTKVASRTSLKYSSHHSSVLLATPQPLPYAGDTAHAPGVMLSYEGVCHTPVENSPSIIVIKDLAALFYNLAVTPYKTT